LGLHAKKRETPPDAPKIDCGGDDSAADWVVKDGRLEVADLAVEKATERSNDEFEPACIKQKGQHGMN